MDKLNINFIFTIIPFCTVIENVTYINILKYYEHII